MHLTRIARLEVSILVQRRELRKLGLQRIAAAYLIGFSWHENTGFLALLVNRLCSSVRVCN